MSEPIHVRSLHIEAIVQYAHEDPYGQGCSGVMATFTVDQEETLLRIAAAMSTRQSIWIQCGQLQVRGLVTKAEEGKSQTLFRLVPEDVGFYRVKGPAQEAALYNEEVSR